VNSKLREYITRSLTKERDLGVVIDRTGQASEQCIIHVNIANTMLGMSK